MIRVNIHDAKTNLSRYLKRVKKGETIVLCKRNVPVAEIRPIAPPPKKRPPPGLYKGQIEIPPSFFEPLDDDLLRAFNGEDE